jgi:hypothetical protein
MGWNRNMEILYENFKSLMVKVIYTHRKKTKSSLKAKSRAPPIRKFCKHRNSNIFTKDIRNN